MYNEGIDLIWYAVIFAIVVIVVVFSITPVIVQLYSKRKSHFYKAVVSGREMCRYRGCDRDADTKSGLCKEHDIWFKHVLKDSTQEG